MDSTTDRAAQSASYDALDGDEEGAFVFNQEEEKEKEEEEEGRMSLANKLETQLEEEEEGEEGEDDDEEPAADDLLKCLHDNERGKVRQLMNSEGRPKRSTSCRGKKLLMPDPCKELGEASCSDSDEAGRWSDGDRTKDAEKHLFTKYGLLQTVGGQFQTTDGETVEIASLSKHATKEDLDFVERDSKNTEEPLESESYVPSDEEEEVMDLKKIFNSSLVELLKALPQDVAVPTYEEAVKSRFHILFADAKDFEFFRDVCGKLYAEILEGPSTSTRKISVPKDMNDTFKSSEDVFGRRMMAIASNIRARVSALNGGTSQPPQNGEQCNCPIHPWHVTWTMLVHAVHVQRHGDIVKLPESAPEKGIPCAVTGKTIKIGEECYLMTMIRKEVGSKNDKLFQSFFYVSKAPGEAAPDAYVVLVLSCVHMWNWKAVMQTWMRKWERDNPMAPSSTTTEEAISVLYTQERGKVRLARLYAQFKMFAAVPEIMLNKTGT